VDPQVGAVACAPGDIFLLCTDGLSEGLYNHHLLELLRPPEPPGKEHHAARCLVEASLQNDGRDNTTALVVEVL
jgi:protein phosphatase